jgi:hypothetical protein
MFSKDSISPENADLIMPNSTIGCWLEFVSRESSCDKARVTLPESYTAIHLPLLFALTKNSLFFWRPSLPFRFPYLQDYQISPISLLSSDCVIWLSADHLFLQYISLEKISSNLALSTSTYGRIVILILAAQWDETSTVVEAGILILSSKCASTYVGSHECCIDACVASVSRIHIICSSGGPPTRDSEKSDGVNTWATSSPES